MKVQKKIFLGLLLVSSLMVISKERIGVTDTVSKMESMLRKTAEEKNAVALAATENKTVDSIGTISPSLRANTIPRNTTSNSVLGNHLSVLTHSKSSFSALTGTPITKEAMLADLNSIIADLDKYYVSTTTEYALIGHTHYANGVPDGNPISNTGVNFDVSKALIIYPGAYYNGAAINFAFDSTTTFDALGDPNAKFIIESIGAINSNINATFRLTNGAQACNIIFVANGGISIGAATTGSPTNIFVVGNWISRAGAVAVGIGTDMEGRILTTAGALAMGNGVLKVPTTGPSFIDFRSLKSFFGATFGAASAIGITGAASTSTVITGDLYTCGPFNNFGFAGAFPGPFPAGSDYVGPGSKPVGAPVTLTGNLYYCEGPNLCSIIPKFTQIAPICSGATLSLPTTSTDTTPITGTWSPALNTTATTTYTFTPTAGTCASTATMTITVNPNSTPTFTQVAAICSGATLVSLPTSSTNATAITGTWSPAMNNLATTTYTFTPTAGICATTATMTITVNPNSTPTFTQVAAICSGATLVSLPTSSTNATAITGTWSPAMNNLATTTYTFTPTAGTCVTTATMTITVNPIVTPIFTQVAPICSGATLASLPTSSADTTPITGTWSPALNTTATTTYTFTPTAGTCASTAKMTITVNPIVTPTFTQVDPIASGALLAALPTFSTNSTPVTGTWSPALDNLLTTEYTFTPTAGLCATTATMTITVGTTTTWNVTTGWDNGAPTFTSKVIIPMDYTATADLTAFSLELTGTANVTVPSGKNFTISGPLTVNPGTTLTFENNANLIQSGTTNTNTGNIIYKRNSSLLLRLDYSLWSSPVANQNLLAFSPLTDPTRFYNYITNTNLYKYDTSPSTTAFVTGTGYLIRKPNDASSTDRASYLGSFTGVPNNGNYTYTMTNGGLGKRFNLVGNPYPSPIIISKFVNDNVANITGTLYFWRKTNNALKPSYCAYSGGTFVANGELEVFDPNGIIQTAQGFFVEAKDTNTTLIFNNTQREANNVGQFFKTKQIERNRIWLNATDILGNFSQMAVGYVTDATQGVDAFDGKYYNDGAIALNSFLDNSNYVIQGRALPFDPADEVPLSFKATKAGDYTIAIDHTDGLFSAAQDIILLDATNGLETDLKAGAYTFTAAAGSTNTRFSLKYQKNLKVNSYTFDQNSVTVYQNKGVVYVNSGKVAIENIKVFDIQGRLITEQKNVKATTASIKDLRIGQQVLIVQITSEDNQVVNKKLVN